MNKPHLILAGPGTGKTTFLISKAVQLFRNAKDKNHGIIVCTFTRKATEELTTRLYTELGIRDLNSVNSIIGTIHSICFALLSRYSDKDYGDYDILPEESQIHFIHSKLVALGYSNDRIRKNGWALSEDLAAIFNKINDEEIDIKSINFRDDIELEEACNVYRTYRVLLEHNKLFDFATIQSTILNELNTNADFHSKIRHDFAFFLIDEYQDVNNIQNKIFIKLAEPEFKITVVGDDDQSIYGFRGSSVDHIINFKDTLEQKGINVKQDILNINYRSTSKIIDYTNALLKLKNKCTDKNIEASRTGISHKPVIKLFEYEEDEIQFITNTIIKLKTEKIITKYSQIAILFRSLKNHSINLVNNLIANEIPFRLFGAGNFFDSVLGLEFIALLDYYLAKEINKENCFYERLKNIDKTFKVKLRIEYEKKQYLNKLEKLFSSKKYYSCIDLVYDIFIATDIFERYDADGQNIGKLTDIVLTFDDFSSSYNPWGLFSYIIYLQKCQNVDYEDITNNDCINLMTIHQSKGLEFPVVFLPSQIERAKKKTIIDRLNSVYKKNANDDNEEIRVLYVGCTRAEDLLIITGSDRLLLTKKKYQINKFIKKLTHQSKQSEELTLSILKQQNFRNKKGEQNQNIILSYNKINLYNLCPLAYKYSKVWNLETVRIGGIEFGRNTHKIIEIIIREIINGKKLESILINKLVESNWKNTNFRSDSENNKFKKAALEQINNLLKNSRHLLKQEKIFAVEDQFNISIKNNFITGRFDVVFQENNEFIIVDFKTGKIKRDNTQLSFYSLCFNQKYSPSKKVRLANYYLNDGLYDYIEPENKDKVMKKIETVANAIRDNKFEPTPGAHCASCAYRNICKYCIKLQ